MREQIAILLAKGWTYASLSDAIGASWYSVRNWHLEKHTPKPVQPVLAMLRGLEDQQAPPKRRYAPDAPQRRSRKGPGES